MAIDERHVALPQLYGAPAYARPTPIVEETPRPFDPDDLPIAAVQTPEERQLAESLPAGVYAPGGMYPVRYDETVRTGDSTLRPRPLSLRGLAGRILRQSDN